MASKQGSLLGRAHEWKTIAEAIDLVHRGSSRTVFIEGEAGIGKTRLVEELVTNASGAGLSVLSGRADELERARPFGAIADALRRFRQEMPSTGGALEGLLRPDSTAGEATVVDAFVDFVEEMSLSRPLCIVLEDLHWADAATIKAVRAVARRLSYLPVLTVGTYRPHPRSTELTRLLDATSREGALELRLEPLDESSLVALIESILSASVGPRLRRIILSAAGNPLYATEIARAVSQEGDVMIVDGVADVERVDLPPTLRLTILRRISFLPVETMELLRLAAVLGASFRIEDLVAVKASPVADVVDSLGPAIEAKIVEERDGGLAFRHDLIQEAIYQDLPSPIRASMHVDTARALRSLGLAPVRMAEHFMRALDLGIPELFDEAVALAFTLRFSASDAAISLYEKALALPGTAEDERTRARGEMVYPLILIGRMDDAVRIGKEVLARSTDPNTDAITLVGVLSVTMQAGRTSEVIPVLEAVAADDRLERRRRRYLKAFLGAAYMRLGECSRAEAIGSEVVASARDDGDDEWGIALGGLVFGVARTSQGWISDGVRSLHEVFEIDTRNPTPAPIVSCVVALTLVDADRLVEARDACQRGRRRDSASGDVSVISPYGAVESWACFLSGAWDEAVTEATTALDLVGAGPGSADFVSGAYASLGQVLLRRGAVEEATRLIQAAERFIEERGPQLGMVLVAWTKGLCVLASGDPSGGLDALVRGWERSASSRYLLSRPVFPDLVRIALEVGDRQRAEEVTEVAEEGRRRAGEVPSAVGVALLCRGLVNDDPEILLAAVDAYRESPRVVERARVCEDAAMALSRRGRSEEARALFEEALGFHEAVDAVLDARRVSAAMREAGLRRGSRAKHRRPRIGWEALTEAELQVARFTVQGLTNPQIADRLFISKHTVQTHLSHVFAKLGVASRVALAGIAAQKFDAKNPS